MTLTKPVKHFLDTNILVYSIDLSLPNRDKHRAALEILRPSTTEILCFSSQVLAEFYAVITSAKLVTFPVTSQEAIKRIERLTQMPNSLILPLPNDLFPRWIELRRIHPVTGANIFDLIHVATMMSHGIKRIYTFNSDDFIWCQEIEVIVPK